MRRAALIAGALVALAVACTAPSQPNGAKGVPAAAAEPRWIPGTEPVVRVWLRSLGDWQTLEVRFKGGLEGDPSGPLARDAESTLVLRHEGGRVRIDGRPGLRERVLFVPASGGFSIAQKAWSGNLEVVGGRLINRVPLENYLLGVMRGELPLRDVPVEGAGALAIAARSYTLYYLTQPAGDYDVDDTTQFQVYRGLHYAPDDAHLRDAVRVTRGLYLAYDARPVKAYYHSTCGGHTTDVPTGLGREASPVMSGVPCDGCRGTPYWRWKAVLSEADVLLAAGVTGPLREIAVAATGAGGRATSLRVVGASATVEVPAADFRLRVGAGKLRSTRILSLTRTGEGVAVEGAGWGHGVGLCQLGALAQARQGGRAADIALYYYPGASLERAY